MVSVGAVFPFPFGECVISLGAAGIRGTMSCAGTAKFIGNRKIQIAFGTVLHDELLFRTTGHLSWPPEIAHASHHIDSGRMLKYRFGECSSAKSSKTLCASAVIWLDRMPRTAW